MGIVLNFKREIQSDKNCQAELIHDKLTNIHWMIAEGLEFVRFKKIYKIFSGFADNSFANFMYGRA